MVFDYDVIFTDAVAQHGDKPALLYGPEALTYTEIGAAVDRMAKALYGLGIRPGDRVALCLGNRPEWVVAFFAISRLRASAVMLSTAWMTVEIEHALRLTEPVAVFADAAKAPMVEEAGRPKLAVLVGEGEMDGWVAYDALPEGPELPADLAAIDPSELDLALPFSSGTTGMPKAVRHSHRSTVKSTQHWRNALGVTEDDRLQALTPLAHILGIVNIGATFQAGATIRLFPSFSPRTMVQSFQDDRITIAVTVAPIAAAIAVMEDLESFDVSSLRYLNWSATPLNPEIAARVTERTGVPWITAYGATETPFISAGPVDQLPFSRLDSVGIPAPDVRIETIDPATLEFQPRGTTGELVVLSPAAMTGYLPADTHLPFLEGGWYRTGDIGYVEPEGWVVVTDRLKELIKVSGFQVSPVEVEGLLATSPRVRDCAVFGMPDERRGEIACAAVVPVEGWEPNAEELIEWLAPQLAPYKRLRDIYFVDQIPRTASGKIQRRKLLPDS